jgi:hypothetical protein
MKQSKIAVQVQGACAEGNTFVQKFALVLFILLASFTLGFCQNLDTISVDQFAYSIEYPEGTITEGDTVELILHLGTEANSLESAAEFDIDIDLSSIAGYVEAPPVNYEESWFGSDGNLDKDISTDSALGRISIQGVRHEGQLISGWGELLRIKVVAGEDANEAAELVSGSGGIVMIDNLEMKGAAAEAVADAGRDCMEWLLYPNPATDRVRVEAAKAGEMLVDLIAPSGGVVFAGKPLEQGAMDIDLDGAGLAPGIYLIQIRNNEGCVKTRRVVFH